MQGGGGFGPGRLFSYTYTESEDSAPGREPVGGPGRSARPTSRAGAEASACVWTTSGPTREASGRRRVLGCLLQRAEEGRGAGRGCGRRWTGTGIGFDGRGRSEAGAWSGRGAAGDEPRTHPIPVDPPRPSPTPLADPHADRKGLGAAGRAREGQVARRVAPAACRTLFAVAPFDPLQRPRSRPTRSPRVRASTARGPFPVPGRRWRNGTRVFVHVAAGTAVDPMATGHRPRRDPCRRSETRVEGGWDKRITSSRFSVEGEEPWVLNQVCSY